MINQLTVMHYIWQPCTCWSSLDLTFKYHTVFNKMSAFLVETKMCSLHCNVHVHVYTFEWLIFSRGRRGEGGLLRYVIYIDCAVKWNIKYTCTCSCICWSCFIKMLAALYSYNFKCHISAKFCTNIPDACGVKVNRSRSHYSPFDVSWLFLFH